MDTVEEQKTLEEFFEVLKEKQLIEGLKEAHPIIQPLMPQIMDMFYDKLTQIPNLQHFFENRSLDILKKLQIDHWLHILSGKIDSEYLERVGRISNAHKRINLPPSWYLVGYNLLLNWFTEAIISKLRFNKKKAQRCINAINTIIFFEITTVVSAYFQGEKEKGYKLREKLGNELDTTSLHVINSLEASTKEMENISNDINNTVRDTTKQTESVMSLAEQTSVNIQSVSFASQQLLESIREINEQVEFSTKMTQKAEQEARYTNETVEGLSVAASRIGEVVKIINDIAEQTNLLALNATIEAARAGEAGKGFSVVAAEVKNLATQTGRATEEITSQINEVQSVTSQAVNAIRSISQTIAQVSEVSVKISEAIKNQQNATNAIANNVDEVSGSTQKVSQTIVKVSKAAQETSVVSYKILSTVTSLGEKTKSLKQALDHFIISLKKI